MLLSIAATLSRGLPRSSRRTRPPAPSPSRSPQRGETANGERAQQRRTHRGYAAGRADARNAPLPAARPGCSLAIVVVAALALHARAIGFGFSYLDDDALILDQQQALLPRTAAGARFTRPYFPSSGRDHAYYRPLVTASYALDAAWSGSRAPRLSPDERALAAASARGLLFLLLLRFGHRHRRRAVRRRCSTRSTRRWPRPSPGFRGATTACWCVFALAAWLLLRARAGPARWGSRAGPPRSPGWRPCCARRRRWCLPLVYAGHLLARRAPSPAQRRSTPWLLGGLGRRARGLSRRARRRAARSISARPA